MKTHSTRLTYASHCIGSSGDTYNAGLTHMVHWAHWAGCNANTIQDLHPQYTTYSHSILYRQFTKLIQCSKKHMIHDTHNMHNKRHTMPDLNNAYTVYTLTVYVTGPAIIDHVSAQKLLIFSVFAVS